MNSQTTVLSYQDRELITENIEKTFSTDPVEGFKLLQSYENHASQDLKRDLLATAWRIALNSADKKLRQKLINYLLNALHGETDFLQGQSLKFLLDFTPSDFDDRAINILLNLPLSGDHCGESIRLIGIANIRSREAALSEISSGFFKKTMKSTYYASCEWAASLALSRFGDIESSKQVIAQVENESDITIRATRLFADIAYMRQPLAFDALRSYLHSKARLPQVKDSVPGALEAIYAAELFAKYIEGCPIAGPDVYEKDIVPITQWADAQTIWEFREQPIP